MFIAFPSLIIAIAVIGVLGNGLQNIAVSVVIATWAWFVRVVRSYSVQEMGKDYILAARISGCNTGKLVFRHLIPNILPQFLVDQTFAVYLAEPVADVFAVTFTAILFTIQFKKILAKLN